MPAPGAEADEAEHDSAEAAPGAVSARGRARAARPRCRGAEAEHAGAEAALPRTSTCELLSHGAKIEREVAA